MLRELLTGCTRRRLLFLSSAFVPATDHRDTLDFFTLLTSKLTERLSAYYDIVLRVPQDNKSGTQQAEFLGQAIRFMRCYDAIVIAPIETNALKAPLSAFMKANPKYPVLTIDKNFEEHLEAFNPHPPPSVIVDGKEGGSLAGKALKRYCTSIGKRNPRVRILQGLEGAEPRVAGCKAEFSDIPGAVSIHKQLSFDSLSAQQRIKMDLEIKDFCDAYFCTNDEMALGVREALIAYEREGGQWPNDQPPIIIGFDGIGTVKSLIRNGDKYMYGTIDARLEDQVAALSDMINTLFIAKEPFTALSYPHTRATAVAPSFFGRIDLKGEGPTN